MLGSNLLFEHKQANAIMQSAINCIHVTSINGFLGDLTAAFLCQSVKVCLKNKGDVVIARSSRRLCRHCSQYHPIPLASFVGGSIGWM